MAKSGSKSTTGRAVQAKGRPGGPGGNKVAGNQGGSPKTPRPGGAGGQKVVSSGGGMMKPRPGGSQPAG